MAALWPELFGRAGWPFAPGRSALRSAAVPMHDRLMIRDDIRVRRVAHCDTEELERFYAELSADSRVLRFHGASRGISHHQAEQFAAADHRLRDGFVAVTAGRIVGHIVLEPMGECTEELGIAVDDGVQDHGVGSLLFGAALASARLRGVRRIVAWVMAGNGTMRHLLAGSHHPFTLGWEGSVARYVLEVPIVIARPVAA